MFDENYKFPDLRPLTKEYLLERGSCCGSKCKNCPYTPKHVLGSKDIQDDNL